MFTSCTKRHVTAFFIFIFILGCLLFKGYGLSWDEPVQRDSTIVVAQYIHGQNHNLIYHHDRYHGPVFELVLLGAEKAFHLQDPQAIYTMRHGLNFMVFFIGTVFFYLLCRQEFPRGLSLLGTAILILSPRIFGQAFYNSKDIPCMVFFIVSAYTLLRFIRKPDYSHAFYHAFATALLIDIRIVGIFMVFITGILYMLMLIRTMVRKEKIGKIFGAGTLFLILLVGVMILFWPILWTKPFREFLNAFKQMKQFPWDGMLLYYGGFVRSTELPWHYIPGWIAATTPVGYLLLFVIGLGSIGWSWLQAPAKLFVRTTELMVLTWLFIPLIAVIYLHAVMYNAWRHMYFIYPALVYIAVYGVRASALFIQTRLTNNAARGLVVASTALAIYLGSIAVFMGRSHPYQDLYFNRLVGGEAGAKFKFEWDYWGITFRKALEHIARIDSRPRITVYASSDPCKFNLALLPLNDRNRIQVVDDPKNADYSIENYLGRTAEPVGEDIYSIDICGTKIARIFKNDLRISSGNEVYDAGNQ